MLVLGLFSQTGAGAKHERGQSYLWGVADLSLQRCCRSASRCWGLGRCVGMRPAAERRGRGDGSRVPYIIITMLELAHSSYQRATTD